MKKNSHLIIFFTAVFFLLNFTACKQELLPSPTANGITDLSQGKNKIIFPPTNIQATQGDYRSVTLTWDSAKDAIQYQIFSASTEFDTFEKKGETKGTETTFTIPEDTGSSKAYYIRSVDYYGNISRPSFIVTGTTLSVPIITDITKNDSGDIYTVNWWMTNCSENTYEDLINFQINCYEEGNNTPSKIIVPGSKTSYDFTNLKQSTVYKFTVEAFKPDTKQKHEISDTEPIETGHRIVPDAVKDLTITKGQSKTDINISFALPPTIECLENDGTYSKDNPVYFTLKRKLADEPDSAYITLYDYIGYNKDGKSPNFKNATKTKVLSGTYTEGALVEIADVPVGDDVRGKQYVYKVQSYTDGAKNYTSDVSSTAFESGWTIGKVTFRAEDNINKAEDTITNVAVHLYADFDSKDIPYTYVVTVTKYDIENENQVAADGAEKVETYTNFISYINGKAYEYNNPEAEKGYYEYKLYVIPKTESKVEAIPANAFEVVTSNKITVSNDGNLLPVIQYTNGDGNVTDNFIVEDGYKNKFILSWNSIPGASYTLKWNTSEEKLEFNENDFNATAKAIDSKKDKNTTVQVKDGKVILTHSAEPGETRTYTLIAKTGLTATKENNNENKGFSTLGIAKPYLAQPDYDKITIKWDPVTKAKEEDAYTISAKYAGENTELLRADKSNYTLEKTDDGKMTCVIKNPDGYKDATKSGKTIVFKVETTSNRGDTTEGSGNVYTLGPANLNLKTDSDIYNDHIHLSWNKIEGAVGYIVYRTAIQNDGKTIPDDGDQFYVTEKGVECEGAPLSALKVNYTDTTVEFFDYYEAATLSEIETDSLKRHQSRISWGTPFGYTVIPVLKSSDFAFSVDSNKIKNKHNNNDFYTNLTQKITSTYGYGLNVVATKAESNTEIYVTWDQPYNKNNLYPKLYHRVKGTTEWQVAGLPTASTTDKLSYTVEYGKNDTNVYEYAVVYNDSNFDQSYLDDLTTRADSTTKELDNQGYTLSLPNGKITATHNNGYRELLDWSDSTYDFTKRKIGPEYYEIQILNKNKLTGWTPIAKIEINSKSATEFNSDKTKVKLTNSQNGQSVFEPIFNNDSGTTTTGQLEVLRDYKHYYRLVAVRNVEVTNEEGTTETKRIEAIADKHLNNDNTLSDVFATRDITPEELMKCVNLIIADAINQASISGGGYTQINSAEGYIKFDHPSTSKTIKWGTDQTDYQHTFTGGLPYDNTPFVSPFIISFKETEERSCADGNKLYRLPKASITVKNTAGNKTYGDSSAMTFEMGIRGRKGSSIWTDGVSTSWVVTSTCKSKTLKVEASDKTAYQNIFPFEIGASHENKITQYNASNPVYMGIWWGQD